MPAKSQRITGRTTFQELMGSILDAQRQGDPREITRYVQQLGEELDKLTGGVATVQNRVQRAVAGGLSGGGGKPTGAAVPEPGEAVSGTFIGVDIKVGSVIAIGIPDEDPTKAPVWAFPADATRIDRMAVGVCSRFFGGSNGGRGPLVYWRALGAMPVLLAPDTVTYVDSKAFGVNIGQPLFVSASEPGSLTTNASEEGATYHQQCGTFYSYHSPKVESWGYSSGYAAVIIHPPASIAAADAV